MSSREAFEKAITVEGLHVNLTRIGPASLNTGEYADVIVQTCWKVWQLALAHENTEQQEDRPKHDGKLPGGDTYEVYYDGVGKDALVCVQGTHNLANYEVVLEPQQALSLLAWLQEQEATLQELAKEQEA
jgi:hypothetical protein